MALQFHWPMQFFKTLIFSCLCLWANAQEQAKITYTTAMMGSPFTITVLCSDSLSALEDISRVIAQARVLESKITTWQPNSQISEANNAAGLFPVKVDWEVFGLLKRSIETSKITNGAFDITYASAYNIWNFNRLNQPLPDSATVSASIVNVGIENVKLNPADTTLFLTKKGVKIDFGGIGQGFIAEQCESALKAMGYQSGVINVSGDVKCWGHDLNGIDWIVAVGNPFSKAQALGYLNCNDMAVVTSGNYEKYFMNNGTRYSHIINPKTGWPTTLIASTTVICFNTELADALATALIVLGVEEGLALINELNGVEAIMVAHDGQIFKSNGVDLQK